MQLNYADIPFDGNGRAEAPSLLLETLSGDAIGVLSGVSNLKFTIKFSEASELTFDVAKKLGEVENPLYDAVSGHKLIYTSHFGVYVTSEPQTVSDGVGETKSVTCYSIEKRAEDKQFFLEEGTYNFYDPTNPGESIIGRILERIPEWGVGEVTPSLIGKYRTFGEYSDNLYSFFSSAAAEKFRCVFVFDPYTMKMSVYDADEERSVLPIYLDFDNLMTELQVTELSSELVTAMRPYGADGLSIYEVNPTGTNWIYDLSHFIEDGSIPSDLAQKWNEWQVAIRTKRDYFGGLIALRANATASLLAKQAELVEIEHTIESLKMQQSITIETLATEKTEAGKNAQQAKLDEINSKLSTEETNRDSKKAEISSLEDEISGENSYASKIKAVTDELALENYFSEQEISVLHKYFVERDLTDETFVATDVETTSSGASTSFESGDIAVNGGLIKQIDMGATIQKDLYMVTGGKLSIGAINLSCDVVRATVEVKNGSFVMSVYAGSLVVGTTSASSGLVTISGSVGTITSDITKKTIDGIEERTGTKITLPCSACKVYITANVSDYQKYAVQEELYQYAVKTLSDVATPTYEFSVDSGNFLFAKDFSPFKNVLSLGCGLYLRISDKQVITPNLIEIALDFEDESSFSMVFSNRFKRIDSVNTLKDMIETSYSSSRSFDAGKYIYNKTSGKMVQVTQFMNSALDAAVNEVIGASNQSVRITGTGIEIGGTDNCQMRIVNKMIAITDDAWQHAKLAIGKFATDNGDYFGVHADVIGGKLIVGNNLVIENQQVDASGNPTGVMQFKVDATGAWLNNSTFVLQKDNGGRILLDPRWGIAGGSKLLFTTSGTTVTPKFVSSDGSLILDKDGMPENANFYFDINNGNAYFRGTVYATDGRFSGTVYAKDGEFTGKIHATSGEFTGTISAATLKGDLVSDSTNGGWLKGCGIDVNNGAFYVDRSGNVTMKGNINLSSGSITWGASNSPVRALYARTQLSKPTGSYSSYPSTSTSGWHKTFSASTDYYVSYSYDGGQSWTDAVKTQGVDGKNGEDGSDANVPSYIKSTYIDGTSVSSFHLKGNKIEAVIPRADSSDENLGFILTSSFANSAMTYLRIYALDDVAPYTVFEHPNQGYARWNFGYTDVYGNVNFRGDVTGITATFG